VVVCRGGSNTLERRFLQQPLQREIIGDLGYFEFRDLLTGNVVVDAPLAYVTRLRVMSPKRLVIVFTWLGECV